MRKLRLFLLAFLLFSLFFTSCEGVVENSNFDTEGYILQGKEKIIPEYVMKIGDNCISLAEYRYYYLNQKNELDGGDDTIWENYPEYLDLLTKYVEDTLVELYAIRTLSAECGVTPDHEKVKEEIKEYKEGLTSSEFKKGLKEYHLTEELYEYILQGYQLYTSLFDYYFGKEGTEALTDSRMIEYVENNYLHAKHILIYPNTTMTDEEYEAYLNTVLYKAKSGEDFDTLILEYSKDTAMPSYGYYFTESEMPEDFVIACKELENGEISDLIKTSQGYHIIKRLDIDAGDLSALTDVVYNEIFSGIIQDKINNIEVEYAPEFEYITPYTLK